MQHRGWRTLSLFTRHALFDSEPVKAYGSRQAREGTLADAHETRDGRIYRDFAQPLFRLARGLHRDESFGREGSETVYTFDWTTLDRCQSRFPWGQFRRRQSAGKLHPLLDVRGGIPTCVQATGGQVHDVNLRDELRLEGGAFYLLHRG